MWAALKSDIWGDTPAFTDGLLDSLLVVSPPDFNMVGGLRPLYIICQVGLGPNRPLANGVVGVKTIVLTVTW